MNQHHCINVTVTRHPETSEVEISAELPAEFFDTHRSKAIQNLGSQLNVHGFRRGHIPASVVENHVGNEAILRETADIAIAHELPTLLLTEKLLPLATPRVTISKIASGNPLHFTMKIEVMPDIQLPDYATIAKKYPKAPEHAEVTDAEFNESLSHIAREQVRIKNVEAGMTATQAAEESTQIKQEDLPLLEEEFVKSLGYESLEQFKEKLRHNLSHEKARRENEKQRISLLDELVAKTNVQLPASLVSHELDKMEAQLVEDLDQAGLTFDQYLQHAQKTKDTLRTEWTPAAIKRATVQLILSSIASKEAIGPDQNKVNELTEHTLTHHKHLSPDNVRAYYTQMLRNEAVIEWLEKQG